MFEGLLKTESHTIRGKEFVFGEYGTDQYLKHLSNDDEKELKGIAIAEHNINFAANVVALSLAVNSDQSVDAIKEEFKALPRALQDELYDKAALLNGITLVANATLGNVSPDNGSQESSR